MQIVPVCLKRAGCEREAASWEETEKMTDMAGGKEKSERQPLRDCVVNPLPHLSTPPPSLPVCFAMVTRQGSQCSQLMCFSVAGTSGVLMCLGLSPAQSMSTVLGCTNTRRAEDNTTVAQPDCEEAACTLPGNLPSPSWASADRNLTVWRSRVSLYRSEMIVFVGWGRWGPYLFYRGQN